MIHYKTDREHPLPESYIPEDLVQAPIPFNCPENDSRRLICSIAYEPLCGLYQASLNAGLNIVGISGFRSFDRQREIYLASIIKNGVDHTNRYIALPGTSEHQTGLALDVSCPSVNYELIEEFAYTPEGIWLKNNCELYGFHMSYPEDSQQITGYNYEPWHICFTCNDANYYVY